ncbi:mannitol 1-phosphate dehydrogenase [Dothidotthia symphoricarpi CBS 119687]|uniref:Mannitol 1-phosphate dehydrogenase n=1 Tax=Dothidotthia symphoricarpi CBS 119687 TaxID=1392245 RepID=A0A6A6AGH6_9PLEO|nr:mannitol 1-phosphate dehydrogenase [Dothidotthia symphoricarpi CBS 119687]KAF2130014.1 mannitol 1-phosphate dehydrogenase [Dothidotthia symphoricarpi CBS 119687]
MASQNTSKKPFNLAIVGGGIAGLTLAITLLQYDIDLTIYEAAPHFGEIGAGVAFGPNAGRAMELMSPKILDAFNTCKTGNGTDSHNSSWFTIRVGDARKADKDGFVKPGKKVGDALFEVPFTKGGTRGGVYRATFLDELVKHVPDHVAKFGKRLDDLSEAKDDSGDLVLHFTDGTTAQHSAVIGCDGIKSKTRPWLIGKDDSASQAFFSGKYAYRGLIPMDQAVELLGEEVAQNSQMFLGYHGHLLTFPVQKGKTMNVVAFSSRKTWDDEKWVVSTSKEEMEADFAEWGTHVQKIVGAMEKPDIWALFMHPPCKTYYKGRLCLLGDAAHATTPHQGAGAGMCIEDSYILANLIKEVNGVEDLERAFHAYDHVRRERTQKNVTTSQQAGMLYDFELHGDDLDKIEESFLSRMGWIWDLDLEAQLEEARKIMHNESAKT